MAFREPRQARLRYAGEYPRLIVPEAERCPRGGVHGWDWDDAALVTIPNVVICWKCGTVREATDPEIVNL